MEAIKTLRDRAVLVKYTGHGWGAHKVDRNATETVAQHYGLKHSRVGWYRKHLLPKDVIGEWWQCVGAARTTHYRNSLPWLDGSVRMVPVMNLENYKALMRKHLVEAQKIRDKIVGNWDEHVRQGKLLQGKLARDEDYPSQEEIEDRFRLDIKIMPVPDIKDWRIDVPAKEMEKMKKEAEQTLAAIQKEAVTELWQRLAEVVEKVVSSLSTPDRVFRNSLFGNIKSVVDLLGNLNVTGDKQLETFRKEVLDKLGGQTPDVVRADDALRSKVAGDAKAILKKMEGFLVGKPPAKKKEK